MSKENVKQISQVATSLNYGRPLPVTSRRISFAIAICLGVCALALTVCMTVVLCTEKLEPDDYWTVAIAFSVVAICLAVIGVIAWAIKQNDKKAALIADCFADAVEINVVIRIEPFMSNGVNNLAAHVAHFKWNGEEYAVSYAKPPINYENRKDLSFYVDKKCRALYSPKHNDVLILKQEQYGEIM